MSSIFLKIFNVFRRRKLVFFSILSIGIASAFVSISSLEIESDIHSILPENSEFKKFNSIVSSSFHKDVLCSVDINGLNQNDIAERLDSVNAYISDNLSHRISNLTFDYSEAERSLVEHYLDHSYYFLNDKDYSQIDSRLSYDSIKFDITRVASQLSSINSIFVKEYLLKDPLGFSLRKLHQFKSTTDNLAIQNQDGLLINTQHNLVLIKAQLADEDQDPDQLLSLEEELTQLQTKLRSKGIKIEWFAPFLVANANAKTIKKDTRTTVLITVIALVVLLFLFYRNLRVSIFFIISVLLSSIFGLGISSLIVENISGLAIAASSVLLGIIVDYSFHVITHYSKSQDIRDTINTITRPLLIGSFTTIVVFTSLMLTHSKVLQDFGLLALCTLSSAVVVNLAILPLIIDSVNLKINARERVSNVTIPSVFKRALFAVALISIALCIASPPKVAFDTDITKLGYYPQSLVELQSKITGLNHNTHKQLLLFTEAENLNNAVTESKELFDSLNQLKPLGISQITSIASFVFTPEESKQKTDKWNEFWRVRKDSVEAWVGKSAPMTGFRNDAFTSFINRLEEVEPSDETSLNLIKKLGLDHLITQSNDGYIVATSLIVNKDSLTRTKQAISSFEGVYLFDTSELASSILSSVKEDFNYLLIFSSLLVFLSLLLIYGRIELALFSFFPLGLIWIWVLYTAQIFGINFNFANILLVTIIFGLGDDYSIFVTDGLLNKYKSNKTLIKTYNTAIVLSALTTTIGTGALYFAKHPSINSIAALGVVGMISIILVTVIVQPIIFDTFILNRARNKLTPITLSGFFITILDFLTFFTGCIIMGLLVGFFFLIPIKLKNKRRILNFLISRLARFILLISIYIKKEKKGFENLDLSSPSIIISNHTSFVDIIVALSLSHKVILVVKDWVSKAPVMGFVLRYSGHISVESGHDRVLEEIKARVEDGYSVLIFPEGTRSPDGELGRFHNGAFLTSKTLGIDIQPILITGCEFISPKGDFIIKKGKITTHVLERIKSDDPIFNKRLGLISKEIKMRLSSQLDILRKKDYDMDFMGNRIRYNYLYKGAILEWHFKVKWFIEKGNYSYCNQVIGDRKRIYDLGGGSGYLSFYLHYYSEDRRITSIDYDEDKVNIAKHSTFKTNKLDFHQAKVEDVEFENFDACVLYDVLHYLSPEERMSVFKNMSLKINPDGLIIIREGISDYKESHKKTKLTEFLSTKIFQFNKSMNKLDFMSLAEVEKISKTFNLSFEIREDTRSLSNVIIVFRKAS
jgi:uncharacterized protein